MSPVQFAVSIVLFFVLFFGISFLVNMLLKTTWFPGIVLFPVITIVIISEASFLQYITEPIVSLRSLGIRATQLLFADYVILGMGLIGALLGGLTIKILRARGYRMF